MNESMYVKPAPGVKVRDPHTMQHLPEDGAHVPVNSYWMRRLGEGSIVEIAEPVASAPEPEAAATPRADK